MHYLTKGLSDHDKAIFKNLERRFFHEGRVVHPSYLNDTIIPQVFSVIKFDCLLHIDEEIYPLFVLKFYKSVRITRNIDQTISIAFIFRNLKIVLPLHRFAKILRVPCKGACMFTVDWSIVSLPKSIDPDPIYHTLFDDPINIRNAIFYERPFLKRLTKKEGQVKRILVNGKRPHPLTSSSSSSQYQPHDQEEVNPVDNFKLDLVEYCNQLRLSHGA
ncbi:hypothetical protein Tco_0528352 [Tanacetum coccineum]